MTKPRPSFRAPSKFMKPLHLSRLTVCRTGCTHAPFPFRKSPIRNRSDFGERGAGLRCLLKVSIGLGALLIAAAVIGLRRLERRQRGQAAQGRGLVARLPARLGLDSSSPRSRARPVVQPDRLRRRHPGDHDAHGRFRRVGRPAHTRPGQGVQELRPGPVGAVGDDSRVRRQDSRPRPEADRARHRRHLPRQDHELVRSAHRLAEPGQEAPVAGNRGDLPVGRVRRHVRAHLVPVEDLARVEAGGRDGHDGQLPGRRRRQGQLGSRRDADPHPGRDRLHQRRLCRPEQARSRFDPERGRDLRPPRCEGDRGSRGRDGQAGTGQLDLDRRPARLCDGRLSDLDVLVRDRAQELREGT